jgi:hypothetical protein
MSLLLATESWPFLAALVLLLSIAAIEGAALLLGASLGGWLDHFTPHLEHGADGLFDAWLGWLHVGKMPILVLLVILLTAFAMIGFTLNGIAHVLAGIYPPPLLSVPLAFIGALPLVRATGATIARIVPRDETTAVSLDTLVGRVAVVVSGTARLGYPAEARVRNEHGQTLYVRVEPDAADTQFGAGDSILLVRQISGSRFQGISNPRPDLL